MPRRVISARTAKTIASRASEGTPRSSDRRIGTGATSAAIRSMSAVFFTPPPATTISAMGGAEFGTLTNPQRDRFGREFDKRGHQIGVIGAMSCGRPTDKSVAIHLETRRFGRTASQIEIFREQVGEQSFVYFSSPSKLTVSIILELAVRELACQTVQGRIGRSSVKPDNTSGIFVQDGKIGDPAEIQDRPPTGRSQLAGVEQ